MTPTSRTALLEDLIALNIDMINLKDGLDLATSAGRPMANVAANQTEVRAERIVAGQVAAREAGKRWGGSPRGRRLKITAEYQAEGAAFFLDPCEWEPEESPLPEEYRPEVDPDVKGFIRQYHAERRVRIEPLVKHVEAIPAEEMHCMVRASEYVANVSPRGILADAAYFADFAMVYPGVRPREGAVERYSQFLSASLLRRFVGTLFRAEEPGNERIG